MKKTIEQETILLPRIIAQTAIWEVLERDYPKLSPERCLSLQNELEPFLEAKANRLYQGNESWRKAFKLKMKASGEQGRDYLCMFMRHWAEGWLRREVNTSRLTKA